MWKWAKLQRCQINSIWLYGYSYIRMIIQYFPRAEVDIMLSLSQILGLAYSLQGKNLAVKYLSFYPSTRVGSNEANSWFTSQIQMDSVHKLVRGLCRLLLNDSNWWSIPQLKNQLQLCCSNHSIKYDMTYFYDSLEYYISTLHIFKKW